MLRSSNAALKYINTLIKCICSLVICAICFSPIDVFATSGGGGTRGGGAGRRTYASASKTVSLVKGYVGLKSNGKMEVTKTDSSSYYVGWLPINASNVRSTAGDMLTAGILTETNNTFLEYYNFNGSAWTKLGTTVWINGKLQLEVPKLTTAIKFISTAQTSVPYSWINNADSEDLANSYGGTASKNYMGNLFVTGLGIGSSSGILGTDQYGVSSVNYWSVTPSQVVTLTNNSAYTVSWYVHYYDSTFAYAGHDWNLSIPKGSSVSVTISKADYVYMRMRITSTSKLYANLMGDNFILEGLDGEVYSTAYQTDNSSISTYINYHEYVDKSVTVTAGDGSLIVIGDNNEIEIGTPSNSLVPGDAVVVPDYEDTDDDGSFFDVIKNLFGGIGKALAGLMEIILMPITMLVDMIGSLASTIGDTITSTAGMNEFFSAFFSWLPAPLPQLIVTTVSAFLIIAIIKFIRG